ncbi:MAG: NAD(P)-dependent oxidoreductase [Lachnospira eligens]
MNYYATEPHATELLLEKEKFSSNIWECACGGHISDVLKGNGYTVHSTDLINRGYEGTVIEDFLKTTHINTMDIITNPPYKFAREFVEHALDISIQGIKIAMFLKLQFWKEKQEENCLTRIPQGNICFKRKATMCEEC